jgi:hypothetical protein
MLVMSIADGQANSLFFNRTSSTHTYLAEGDILIGVNDFSCTNAKTTLLDIERMVDQSNGKLLTLTFRRPDIKTDIKAMK